MIKKKGPKSTHKSMLDVFLLRCSGVNVTGHFCLRCRRICSQSGDTKCRCAHLKLMRRIHSNIILPCLKAPQMRNLWFDWRGKVVTPQIQTVRFGKWLVPTSKRDKQSLILYDKCSDLLISIYGWTHFNQGNGWKHTLLFRDYFHLANCDWILIIH